MNEVPCLTSRGPHGLVDRNVFEEDIGAKFADQVHGENFPKFQALFHEDFPMETKFTR